MKTRQLVLILAVAALGCLTHAADNSMTSQYTGTVVDEKGQPVAGATVDCYQSQSRSGFGFWGDREPEFQQTTMTDGKGAFTVSASADTALVVVKKAGFATVWKNWRPQIPDSTAPIVLPAPATLSGVVMDDDGKPVAGALVWVAGASIGDGYDLAAQMNELQGQAARTAFSSRTDADGRFRIENFPTDGRAGLAVSKPGMAQHALGSDFASQSDSQPGQDLKLVVGPAGSVEGKVIVAETGQPLGGVKIKLDEAESGVFGSTYTEAVESRADGTFRVPDVQPGKHYIRASIAGGPLPDWVLVPEDSQVTVVAGETARNVVVHFSKGALVEVTVVVTNKQTPLANVAVSSSGGSTAYTDGNGVALVRASAGEGWFFATKEDWSPEHNKAVIKAGVTNHVQIEMIPPPRITGTIRDPSGAPVAGAIVSFHPGQYPAAPKYVEVQTDASGRYELTMKEESSEFWVWNGPISPTNFIMAQSLERNLAAIQEFDALPTNLDLTLQLGITLTGSVKDTEGAPVTNATVDISMLSGHSIPKLWPQPVKVDAQGSFTLPALPQGREYEFWPGINAKGFGTAGGILKDVDSKTNYYEFPTFVLKRADLKLAGQVLGRDGKAVVGARVDISGQGQLMFRETKSDGQGHFSFDGVCAGEIKVDARYYTSPDFRNSEQGDVSVQGGDTNVVVRMGIFSSNTGKYLSPLIKSTGTVRNPAGAAAAGVTVSLFPVQGRPIEIQTGPDGRYELNWQARTGGSEETTWLLARDLKRNLAAIHQVDEKMTNLDLTLQEGLTLSIQVKDSGGQAVTNATATETLWEGNRGYGLATQPVPADNRGRIRLVGLPQGNRYWIQIEAPGHTSATLHAEADDTKINLLELPPAVLELTDRNVSGQVLDVDGKPAANIDLTLFAAGQIGKRTMTDSEGHFLFQEVKRGAVSISAGLPVNGVAPGYRGSASAKGGDTNVVIHLTVNNNRQVFGTTITTSGTVFGPSGVPAPGVLLAMLPSGGLRSPIRSDANGKYTLQWQTTFIRTTTSTKAMIVARDPEHNLAATDDVVITTTNLDLYLRPGFTLSGSVEDSNGNPVTNAIVQLVVNPSTNRTSTLNQMPPTNASRDGVFSINALPQGTPCSVQVSASGYGSSNVTVLAADTKTQQLKLPAIVLNFANKQVAGQVLGLDGKPCWGAQISISGDGQPTSSPGEAATSDAKGHFVVRQVCEGLLTVRAMLPASATNPRYLVSTVEAHGGDKNVVLKLHYP
jgi:protocatechuate 3,4-dioxygenase beta subunit